jgi:hypothetical protein
VAYHSSHNVNIFWLIWITCKSAPHCHKIDLTRRALGKDLSEGNKVVEHVCLLIDTTADTAVLGVKARAYFGHQSVIGLLNKHVVRHSILQIGKTLGERK